MPSILSIKKIIPQLKKSNGVTEVISFTFLHPWKCCLTVLIVFLGSLDSRKQAKMPESVDLCKFAEFN